MRSEPWAQQSGGWYRLGKGELGSRETRQEAEGPRGVVAVGLEDTLSLSWGWGGGPGRGGPW